MVLLLTVSSMLAFFHRLIITLLAEPIKAEFALSDTALALLMGTFFTVSYVIAVMPIARLSDRSDRGRIIAVCVILWSTLTSLSLFARSFAVLAMIRIGVGAAQSGLAPASASLLADHFPPPRLAKAVGCVLSGVYLGGGLAMLAGGWLAAAIAPSGRYELWMGGTVSGWQLILFLAGLPGIAFGALLMRLQIHDPRRHSRTAQRAPGLPAQAATPLPWRSQAHLGLIGALALMIFVANAAGAWIPALFQRAYGWSTTEVGLRYGATIVVCGTLGAIGGGWLASALRRQGRANAHLVLLVACFAALTPVTVVFPLLQDPRWALAMIALMKVLAAGAFGVGYALLQEVTPIGVRARVAGMNALLTNVVGGALAPIAVALFTDHVFGDPARLPEAIAAAAAIGSILACVLLWIGIRPLWQTRGLSLRAVPASRSKRKGG